MHRGLLVIGVALVATGLVLSFVPLFAGPSKVLTSSQPEAAFNATTPISLTGSWTIGMTWSSNHAVSLLVFVCRSINLNAPSFQTVCPGASSTLLNGTSGAETFSVPLGGTLLIGIVSNQTSGVRVDVQLQPALPLDGTILVIAGAGVVVIGLLPRRKAHAVPPPHSDPPAS